MKNKANFQIILLYLIVLTFISGCMPQIIEVNKHEALWREWDLQSYEYTLDLQSHERCTGVHTYTIIDGKSNDDCYISIENIFELSDEMDEESCYVYNIEYNQQYGFIQFFNKVLGNGCELPSERQFMFKIIEFKEL